MPDLYIMSVRDWRWLRQSICQLLALVQRTPTRLAWEVPLPINKLTGATMPGTVTITDDHDVRIGLKWSDDVGPIGHPPTTGTTVTSDNTAVISGGEASADDTSVVLHTAGDGTCNVTVSNGSLKDTIQVVVSAATPTELQVDPTTATPVAKGTTA